MPYSALLQYIPGRVKNSFQCKRYTSRSPMLDLALLANDNFAKNPWRRAAYPGMPTAVLGTRKWIADKDVNQVPKFHVEAILKTCAPRCEVVMRLPDAGNATDAVKNMQVLRDELTEDLDDIEKRTHELAQSPLATSNIGVSEMQVNCVARALYSGLAFIKEVLGLVRLMAAKDSAGNVSEVVKALPTVQVFSIH